MFLRWDFLAENQGPCTSERAKVQGPSNLVTGTTMLAVRDSAMFRRWYLRPLR